MTCQLALTLIDNLVDGELSPAEAEQVRQHLDGCKKCREEYGATRNLKKVLKRTPTYDPGPDYWSETASLIRARTIESPVGWQAHHTTVEKTALQRRALVRSLVSVAASLFLLVSAVLVGSHQDQRISRLNVAEAPILATAPVSELLGDDKVPIVTRAEQVRLAKGLLLMGNPGFLGRFAGLPDLMPVREE